MKTARLLIALIAVAVCGTLHASSARAAIKTQYLDYKHDETLLSGYLAYDDAAVGRRPGVLLVHFRGGLSDKTLSDAQMIARLGYVVFALDMFGKGILPKTVPEMRALTGIYDRDRALMRARAQAGLEVLQGSDRVDLARIAVIGYCFGGTVAVELAESGAPLAGVVSVHGSFRNFAPEAAKNIKGRVLILHGAEDATAPLEEVSKLIGDLRTAKVAWQLELYSGAAHGFTMPGNPSEERADAEYKAAVQRFFNELF
jgi:dienelactone hydrolase